LRRRFRQALVRAGVTLAVVLAWQLFVRGASAEPAAYPYQRAAYQYSNVPYVENIALRDPFAPEKGSATSADLLRRAWNNVVGSPAALGEAVAVSAHSWTLAAENALKVVGLRRDLPEWVGSIPVYVLGALVLAGAVMLVVRREYLMPLYLLVTIGVLCATPWTEQLTRYLTPLAPLLCVMLVYGIASVATGELWPADVRRESAATRPQSWPVVAVAIALVLALGVAFAEVTALKRMYRATRSSVTYYDANGAGHKYAALFYGPELSAMDDSFEWLRTHASPGDVVASSVPQVAYLRSGRKAVLPPMEVNAEEARRLLDAVPVRYVVVDEFTYPGIGPRYARPAVEGHPELWKLAYTASGSDTKIYERLR
jgi:hypothetical protein